MIEPARERSLRQARRQRLSFIRRDGDAVRRTVRRGLARYGFHGVVMAVGLSVVASAWQGPHGFQSRDRTSGAGDVVDATNGAADGALDALAEGGESLDDVAALETAGEPLKPIMRTVGRGDTVRTIADEYSVSISTILASNQLDDPDLIRPGQELWIPPMDGVVADVEPGETLTQLAMRFGAEAEEIARVNALPVESDEPIPYERVIVPGVEPVERAIAPRRDRPFVSADARADLTSFDITKPTTLTYEIQPGDTIKQLSAQFGLEIRTILSANSLSDPNLLKPGTQLKVLPVNGVEHEVRIGESLGDIASYYEVDLGPLVDFNPIPNVDQLPVGVKLTIPGTERVQPGAPLSQLFPVRPAIGPSIARLMPEPVVPLQPRRAQPAAPAPPRLRGSGEQASAPSSTSGAELTAPAPTGSQAQQASRPPSVSQPAVASQPRPSGAQATQSASPGQPQVAAKPQASAPAKPDAVAARPPAPVAAKPPAPAPPKPDAVAVKPQAPAAPKPDAVAAKPQVPAAPKPDAVGAKPQAPAATKPSTVAAKPQMPAAPKPDAVAAKPQAPTQTAQASPARGQAPQAQAAPAPNRLAAASVTSPTALGTGAGGGGVVSTAMKHLGSRYVYGGTSPGGFDCSGFVWYVHQSNGVPVSRGLWGQMNGGPRVGKESLKPGDSVFFANTYMPGLSHAGIYIGGGNFIHASDERTGVTISSVNDGYWGPRFVGGSRLQ